MSTRPHALRRALAWLNAALVLAVLGLAARYVFSIRPAVAGVTPQTPVNADVNRTARPAWTPALPVSRSHLDSVFFRPEYRTRRPAHWPFVGPPMGPEPAGPPREPTITRMSLEELGAVAFVVGGPGDFVISFAFRSGKTLPFGAGEIVRASPDEPARFRLVGVTHAGDLRYRIRYEVLEADGPRSAELLFDAEATLGGNGGLEPVGPDPGPEPAPRPPAPTTPYSDEPDWRALTVRVERAAAGDRHVSFDRPTWQVLRRHGRRLLEEVSAKPVHDPVSGAPVGVRLAFARPEIEAAFKVKRGDVLVSVNGRPIRRRADLVALADSIPGEAIVTVVIERYGRRLTYRVDPRDPRVVRGRGLVPR